jgi:hypothetical protein
MAKVGKFKPKVLCRVSAFLYWLREGQLYPVTGFRSLFIGWVSRVAKANGLECKVPTYKSYTALLEANVAQEI